MTSVVSIRRASLEDVETLVDLRLALERESGHLTQDTMLADVRRATRQYFLEALPTEHFPHCPLSVGFPRCHSWSTLEVSLRHKLAPSFSWLHERHP